MRLSLGSVGGDGERRHPSDTTRPEQAAVGCLVAGGDKCDKIEVHPESVYNHRRFIKSISATASDTTHWRPRCYRAGLILSIPSPLNGLSNDTRRSEKPNF